MNWADWLRDQGVDPDSLEAGQEINLSDISRNKQQKAAGPPKASRSVWKETSPAEHKFMAAWAQYGDPAFVMERQLQFHSSRRWKADFAFPEQKVIVEIEGMSGDNGGHVGRHRSFNGYMNDCEKYNGAILEGWLVFRIPSLWLYDGKLSRKAEVCADLLSLLRSRHNST